MKKCVLLVLAIALVVVGMVFVSASIGNEESTQADNNEKFPQCGANTCGGTRGGSCGISSCGCGR